MPEPFTWRDCAGWFDFQDIYDEAAQLPHHGPLVEVGVYHGRSFCYLMAESLMRGHSVVAVDSFEHEVPSKTAWYGHDTRARFLSNTERCGFAGKFRLIEADSAEAAAQFEPRSCGMVFIDADHAEVAVARDIAAWRDRVARGGIFAGHDIDHTEVRAAVVAALGREGKGWEQRGRCWVAKEV